LIFILRKIFYAFITLFLVSVLCFLAFSVIRGDPASASGGMDITQEQLRVLREEMGLNRNVFIRYFEWLINFIRGDSGSSYYYGGETVSFLVEDRLPVTIALASLSLILIIIISFSVSLLTVKREGGMTDNIINIFTAAGISAPGFFMGLILIFIFGFTFKLFVPGEFIDYKDSFSGFIGCLIPPALAITIPNSAIMIKFLRGSIFHEMHSDYVRTARSKGGKSSYILIRHVLKNACLPAVTMMGMIIAEVFSGSIIIEQVFSIHGTGRLLITAIGTRDYPLIQALMVYIAFLVVCANTLAEIVIMIIDPRIMQTGKVR